MELYHGIISRGDITESYYGSILRNHPYEKGRRDPWGDPAAPRDPGGPGIPWASPWDPRGRPWDPRARPWDPQARPWDLPRTPLGPQGTPMDHKNNHISTNRQR